MAAKATQGHQDPDERQHEQADRAVQRHHRVAPVVGAGQAGHRVEARSQSDEHDAGEHRRHTAREHERAHRGVEHRKDQCDPEREPEHLDHDVHASGSVADARRPAVSQSSAPGRRRDSLRSAWRRFSDSRASFARRAGAWSPAGAARRAARPRGAPGAVRGRAPCSGPASGCRRRWPARPGRSARAAGPSGPGRATPRPPRRGAPPPACRRCWRAGHRGHPSRSCATPARRGGSRRWGSPGAGRPPVARSRRYRAAHPVRDCGRGQPGDVHRCPTRGTLPTGNTLDPWGGPDGGSPNGRQRLHRAATGTARGTAHRRRHHALRRGRGRSGRRRDHPLAQLARPPHPSRAAASPTAWRPRPAAAGAPPPPASPSPASRSAPRSTTR